MNREFILHTGQDGFDIFNEAVSKQNTLNLLYFLLTGGNIPLQEFLNLKKLIDSPDPDSYTLAKGIIDSYDQVNK